ncbi:glyoxylate/hydroxypyruvate reductase A-like [Gordionus sp. m RMFG-2023]|uniref:glyoxylate/hydroxypyruvate reductase A-like n=1 Tax=Gordionus sp. m RMFG-2023 TaxID=3053472 RepID=UPI0031FC217B
MIKAFPAIEFLEIPVERNAKECKPILNDEIKRNVKHYEFVLADAAVGALLIPCIPNIKWIQSVSAGVDGFFKDLDKKQIPKELAFTRMTGVFGTVMAEYVIAQIIIRERHFYQMHDNQKLCKWDSVEWGYRTFSDLTIGFMGLGDIGEEISRSCKAFGANIVSLTRSRRRKSETLDISMVNDEMEVFLKSCDYIVSVLPSIPSTKGMLNGDVLKAASDKKPILVNIGRGDLISEEDLIRAIEQNWISGAILDVFETEPLPPDSKLWTMPQITITPHVSGTSMPSMVAKVFKENMERYENNMPLLGLVDYEKEF